MGKRSLWASRKANRGRCVSATRVCSPTQREAHAQHMRGTYQRVDSLEVFKPHQLEGFLHGASRRANSVTLCPGGAKCNRSGQARAMRAHPPKPPCRPLQALGEDARAGPAAAHPPQQTAAEV
eukprot:scaffold1588_cov408-Prasinococcus_capsulatus_cf.AAC.6